ncbi:MAG: hypothetical protein WA738_06935, partial [Candidatus Angelobacter sp.]
DGHEDLEGKLLNYGSLLITHAVINFVKEVIHERSTSLPSSGGNPILQYMGERLQQCSCPQSSSHDNKQNNNKPSNSVNQQSDTRLPQDKAANPKAPAANNGNSTVGPNAAQNAEAQADAAAARSRGATDIRTNQQQVNAQGDRVGINRPDNQWTETNGQRVYTEYEKSANGRGDSHAARTQTNDPNGAAQTKIIK